MFICPTDVTVIYIIPCEGCLGNFNCKDQTGGAIWITLVLTLEEMIAAYDITGSANHAPMQEPRSAIVANFRIITIGVKPNGFALRHGQIFFRWDEIITVQQ